VPDLTIGELAARSGVATSALRFWEQQGLIVAERTDGNQRRYPRATLRRVALIQAGSAAGVPLRRIGEALATLPHDHTPTKRDWTRLSRVWRNDLEAKIAELERLRDDLTGCIGCGCLSLRSCRLFNPGDRLAEQGPGPRKLMA
jgi:MerR family transcriptional regulator, redox-sensitive transcriptional activator SoxR